MTKFPIANTAAMVTCAFLMASCGQGTTTDTERESANLALMSVDLVDAPVDSAANVVIRVKGMTLHSPGGDDINFHYCADASGQVDGDVPLQIPVEAEIESQPQDQELDAVMADGSTGVCDNPEIREIDLLALTDGKSKRLLDNISVPVGDYPWIRLEIDENRPGYIVLDDGTTHDLAIPGAAKTGLKLVSGFDVEAGAPNQILIDFDLRKSVHRAGPNYRLKPALRLLKIRNASKQRLRGEWLAADMGQCQSPMAYVYEGSGIVPDDIGGSGAQPLTTAVFVADEDGTRFTYRVDYIGYGDYTVAFTCHGETDSAESDDDLVFVQATDVTVAE